MKRLMILLIISMIPGEMHGQAPDTIAIYQTVIGDLFERGYAKRLLLNPNYTKFDESGFARGRGGIMPVATQTALIPMLDGAHECPLSGLSNESARVAFSRVRMDDSHSATVMADMQLRSGKRAYQVVYRFELEREDDASWQVESRDEVYSAHGVFQESM